MPELMKGHTWAARKDATNRKGERVVRYPVSVEPKYDEIRCHIVVRPHAVAFLSYAGKPLHNMGDFDILFRRLAERTGFTEFDCGFEVNGNFNDSYRWVRSSTGVPVDLEGADNCFYLFDLPESPLPWKERRIKRTWTAQTEPSGWLHTPTYVDLYSEAAVLAFYEQCVQAGREGVMVKLMQHTYQRGKRTDGWLKLKPEETADGKIVQVVEAHATVANPADGIKVGDGLRRVNSVEVVLEDGSHATPHGIEHDLGRKMFEHPEKYIGQWCEFKYMARDRQGGYRHPTFKRLREEK